MSDLQHKIEQANELLNDLEQTIAIAPNIGKTLKNGISTTIEDLRKIIYSFGNSDLIAAGGLPDIELDFMKLIPHSREAVVEGEVIRLPRSEFNILYSLACNVGQEVEIGTSHALLTRISAIRKAIPATKNRIESLGKGRYVLNAKLKK